MSSSTTTNQGASHRSRSRSANVTSSSDHTQQLRLYSCVDADPSGDHWNASVGETRRSAKKGQRFWTLPLLAWHPRAHSYRSAIDCPLRRMHLRIDLALRSRYPIHTQTAILNFRHLLEVRVLQSRTRTRSDLRRA